MNHRPILFPTATALEPLVARVESAVEKWSREWLCAKISAPLVEVSAAADDCQAAILKYETIFAESGRLWIHRLSDSQARFRQAVGADISGEPGRDDWMTDVAGRAQDAFTDALCSSILGGRVLSDQSPSERLPRDLLEFGSAVIKVTIESLGVHVVVAGDVWTAGAQKNKYASSRLPKLTPLDQSLGRSRIRLEVGFGKVEIDLSALLDIRCGDVLRLAEKLTDPLTVSCAERKIARASLAELNGRKSAQITDSH